MKVLFINEYLPQEMLGIMWLSRAIKDAGHETKCLFLPDKGWVHRLREYAPDVVCYSVTTGMQVYFLDINKRVKQVLPGIFSVMGNAHPTFSPEILEEHEHLDAICRGEGEEAMAELLTLMEQGEDFYGVQNMWFRHRETGEIIKNGQRPPVADLDTLGFPDREVVYDAAPIYRDADRKVFVSQRGCPMNCSFCFHHALKKKIYGSTNAKYVRKRSVDHLIAELKEVRAKYNLKFVHFVDDIFNLSGKWLDEFCEKYRREIGLPFDVILMANMTNERHIQQLRKAGCVYARIAFEAANDHIRNDIFRKNTTLQQLKDAAGWIRKHGIRLGSLNILGAPGASMEDEFDTIRLNIECKVDHPMVSLMQPYPMFDITDMTEQMGYAVSSLDQFPINFRRTVPVEFEQKHQLENLHKLFPIVVRNPWLMPMVPRLIKARWLYRPLLILFMLHAEYLVAEQAKLYAHAQGLSGPRYWTWVDFARRVVTKGTLRAYRVVFGKIAHNMALRLQMGDERVVAHMD